MSGAEYIDSQYMGRLAHTTGLASLKHFRNPGYSVRLKTHTELDMKSELGTKSPRFK